MCNCGNDRIVIIIKGWRLLFLCSSQLPHASLKLDFLTNLFFAKYVSHLFFFFFFFFKAKVGLFTTIPSLFVFPLVFVSSCEVLNFCCIIFVPSSHLCDPNLIILCPKVVLGPKSILGLRLVVLSQKAHEHLKPNILGKGPKSHEYPKPNVL